MMLAAFTLIATLILESTLFILKMTKSEKIKKKKLLQ